MASLQGAVNPDGFDASSGVEDAPGIKNLSRVEALLRAVRAHQESSDLGVGRPDQ